MKIKKIIAADLCGKDISNGIKLEYKESDGLVACFASLKCENGLKGDETLVLMPEFQLCGECLAIENHSPFWCRPAFTSDISKLPERTVELLVKRENRYACVLTVCADTLKTLIRGGDEGMELWAYTNIDGVTELDSQLCYLYAEGEDPHEILEKVAKKAAELLGNNLKMRSERKLPGLFNYLGWCSWDAMQIRVSHEGLLTKAKEFKEKNVPVGFAIIDDMWGQTPTLDDLPADIEFKPMVKIMHDSPISEFEGSKRRFPQGMKGAITDLKDYIPHVGVWFPTTGYWKGICEDGPLYAKHAEHLTHIPPENGNGFRFTVGKELNVDVTENGKWLVKPDEENADLFFGDLMERVKEWGGDFVKIDNQGCHTHYKNIAPIGKSGRALQKAIDKNAFKYFNGALINCMGMPSECMFNRPNSAVSRCSDDFMPESRAWFSKNILQCAYNGLLQGQFYINDWDMWWTDDEQAVKNSVCRSISGGPVYVSDKIGRTRPEVLKPICYEDGRIAVCDLSAKPTADCLTRNPIYSDSILKIFNRLGESGVIAAYNVSADNLPLCGSISAADAGMPDTDVAYFEYFSKKCGVIRKGERLEVTLKDNDALALYTLVPLKKGRAVFGRIDKYVSRGALISENCSSFELYEGGEIGVYSESEIKAFAFGRELEVKREGNLYVFNCERAEKTVSIK